jgi:hypothetical protein
LSFRTSRIGSAISDLLFRVPSARQGARTVAGWTVLHPATARWRLLT